MAGVTELNSDGIVELLNSDDVRDDLTSRMERALSSAQSSAPVETGAYRDGLKIRQDTTDRVAVRLEGTAEHSRIVEARLGILARALDAAGGD